MTRTAQQARALKAALDEAAWDEHNRRLDEALARWEQVERELSELHIRMAREIREALP